VSGRVRLGLIEAEPVVVRASTPELLRATEDWAAGLRARHAGQSPSGIPGLEAARALYRAFGVDPTRTRPSSEALLRRAVQGKPLPRVVNAVDLCNDCALRFLLPIGLYDLAKVRGEVTLRVGRPGESYPGIRKEDVGLEGRLVLADADGAFGNPTSDSLRTAVDAGTRHLWMVIFAPFGFPAATLEANARDAAGSMERYLGDGIEPVRASAALEP
jgi:DNA/RNA-binding domain of Phe-tRNA-synthetase-like protein